MYHDQPRPRTYRSYMLRIWRSAGPDRPTWYVSLEHTTDGRRHAFTSMEDLMAFLCDEVDQSAREQPDVHA